MNRRKFFSGLFAVPLIGLGSSLGLVKQDTRYRTILAPGKYDVRKPIIVDHDGGLNITDCSIDSHGDGPVINVTENPAFSEDV